MSESLECSPELSAELRLIHWKTLGSKDDGSLRGKPVCGCCAWLDGVRKPWPCDTLKAVGVSE